MKKILTFIFLAIAVSGIAQTSGWDLIKSNDFVKAKEVFQADLKKDSLDINALHGLIFLSETSNDFLSAKKHVATVNKNYPEQNFYITFKSLYSGETKQFVEMDDFSMQAKLTGIKKQALELYKTRKYKEAKEKYDSYIRDLKWSYIGPFSNESGYGHKQVYAVEDKDFDTSKYYFNEDKNNIKWVKPKHVDEMLDMEFATYLGDGIGSPTYFANTFFTTANDQTVQFRLSRSWPLKIWLDDALVFDSDVKINDLWDNEIVQLELKKGAHRLFLKTSAFPSVDDRYQLLNFQDGTGYDDAALTLRLTDTAGKPIDFTSGDSSYEKVKEYRTTIIKNQQLTYWKQQLEKKPEDWFNYYAIARFYSRASLYQDGEVYFKEVLDKNPDQIFFKYMLSKFYAYNGKVEKMYSLLNGVDEKKTPIYKLMYEKFKELDIKNDKELWKTRLDALNEVSPSNWDVIKSYIKYYDTNGEDDLRDDFIKDMMKKYPIYKKRLEYQEKRFSQKPTKSITEKEKKKALAESSKRLQKKFSASDYYKQIRHYKKKDNVNKVLGLYDEMIKHRPYETSYREKKSDYLFENSKFDEAIAELNNILENEPYNTSIIEQIGDIYLEQKKKDQALVYYDSAYVNASGYYLSSLDKKMEKIRGPRVLKSLFETKTLDEILTESGDWREKYKEFDAIVLAYTNDLILDEKYTMEQYQQIMVGINTTNGIKKWTEFDFGFLGRITSAKILKSNGSVVRPNSNGGYLVFKDLQPGDVIQIQGKRSHYNWYTELGRELYQYKYISFSDPLFYNKTAIALPENTDFNYYVHKLDDNLKKSNKEGFDFYEWEFSNVSEVTEESAFIDNVDAYSHIMFSTMKDWTKAVEWYQKKTYKRLELTQELKVLLAEIVKGKTTDAEKVEAVYNYITSEIKYSYVDFLNSNFIPKRTDLTCSAKIGDCKDVATLMISMLRELDIESYYVLVKTEHYSSSYMLPSIYFDHVIVGYILNNKMRFADLTTDFYPLQVLPEMDVDQYGLIIRDGEKELIKLPKDNLDVKKSSEDIIVKAKLHENRSIDLNINATYNGNSAGKIREYFSRYTEEEKYNYVIESIGDGTFNNLVLKDYKIESVDQISIPLKMNYEAVVNTYSSSVLDLIILKVPYMTTVQYSAALSSPNRVNGLDLSYVTNVSPTNQKVIIEFPSNHIAVDLPKNVSIDNAFGTYSINYLKKGKIIEINRKLTFKKQRITPQEYPAFRAFFLKMLDEDSRYIALKKK